MEIKSKFWFAGGILNTIFWQSIITVEMIEGNSKFIIFGAIFFITLGIFICLDNIETKPKRRKK